MMPALSPQWPRRKSIGLPARNTVRFYILFLLSFYFLFSLSNFSDSSSFFFFIFFIFFFFFFLRLLLLLFLLSLLFPVVKFYLLNSAVFNRIAFLYVCRTGQSINTDGVLDDMCAYDEDVPAAKTVTAVVISGRLSPLPLVLSWPPAVAITADDGRLNNESVFLVDQLWTSNLNVTHDLSCLCACFVTRVNIVVLD